MKRVAALSAAALGLVLLPVHASAAPTTSDVRLSYTVTRAEHGTRKAIDSSSYHNNGILKGGVTRKYGRYQFHSYKYRGRHDRIAAPDSPSLSFGTSPFSYSVRLKIKQSYKWGVGRQMAVIRHGDEEHGTGANWKLELDKRKDGKVAAACTMHSRDGGAAYIRGRGNLTTLADGHFHSITCSRQADGSIGLWVGGTLRTRPAKKPLTDMTGQAALLIGCQVQKGAMVEQFVGQMDNITIAV